VTRHFCRPSIIWGRLSTVCIQYSARAGTTTAYYWGDDSARGNANCDGCGSEWELRQTAPVGSFKPNSFALYDMAGNVWQSVEDTYQGDYLGAPSDGSAWVRESNLRMVRGGVWYDGFNHLRAAFRYELPASIRDNGLGFRVTRTLSP
jgi:formylglycine-generating enzyme required for sulfatase activity